VPVFNEGEPIGIFLDTMAPLMEQHGFRFESADRHASVPLALPWLIGEERVAYSPQPSSRRTSRA
jgi:hypothetical protein